MLVIFFFSLGLELIHEIKNGELKSLKTASIPGISAIGGVLVPVLLFAIGLKIFGITQFSNGWAIPTATDVAFSLVALSIFGKKLKKGIKLFVLVLAVVDDVIGIFIIAFLYSNEISGIEILGVIVSLLVWRLVWQNKNVRVLQNSKTLKIIVLAICAFFCWFFTYKSGIHPTISGVFLGLLVPANSRKSLAYEINKKITPFCNYFIIPVFAVVSILISTYHLIDSFSHNSNIDFNKFSNLSVVIALALLIGKPFGILLFGWISAHLTPFKLFHGLRVRDLIGASIFCGIGFTVSILISTISYEDHLIVAFAQIGIIIGSILSVICGVLVQLLQNHINRINSKSNHFDKKSKNIKNK